MRKIKVGDRVRFCNKQIEPIHFCHVYEINNKYGFTFIAIKIDYGSVVYLGDLNGKQLDRPLSQGGSWYSAALELDE